MPNELISVLIVDDDAEDIALVRDLLAQATLARFQCVGAEGYDEGARRILEGDFDVCLVDYRMGARSGLDFLKDPVVRARGVPTIMFTGQSTTELDREAMRSGAADYLPKGDLTTPLLERAIHHALGRARRHRDAERIRFQAELLDAVGEGVVATDLEGRVTFWNRAAEALFGWAAQEVESQRITELFFAQGPPGEAAEGILAVLVEGGSWNGEVEFLDREHRPFPGLLSAAPLRGPDGEVTGTVGVVSDLTQRKTTEAQLRERVKELRALNAVSELMNQRHLPLGERLDAVVDVLPPGLRWPEISGARLTLGGVTAHTEGFRETEWMISEDVPAGATEGAGRLDLALLQAPPVAVADPFLDEERELLANVARAVGQTVARERVTRVLSQTFASLDEAVVVLDSMGDVRRIRYVNPAAERMFGGDADELLDLIPEELHPSWESFHAFGEEASRVLAAGETFRGTFTLRRLDGTLFQAEQAVSLLEPAAGPVGGVVTVVRDVTRRAAAEAALRESEERFRHLAEHINDVFWVTNADKSVVEYVSPAYSRIWGRTRESLYQDPLSWSQAIHPDDRSRIEEAERRQSDGGYDVNYRVQRPDGSIRWIHDRAFPVHDEDGALVRIVGVAEDVTERRMAEERFRVLGEEMTDVVIVIAPDGRILFGSHSAEWMTGHAVEDLVGANALDLVHDDDRGQIEGLLREVVMNPDRNVRCEFRLVRADGTVRDAESVARNLMAHPAVRGIVVTTRDITERLILERRLRQGQKMEAVGRLAGGIAHDFNNILTVIRSETELLLLEDPEGGMAEDLEVIRSAADRAATLTSQLLAFSREQVLRPRTVTLSAVVRGLGPLVERTVGENIEVHVDLPDGDEEIQVDPDQLQQVILNLVVNARDAMPHGGTLTIVTDVELLEPEDLDDLPGLTPGRYATLRIRDTGVGMNPATAGRIFDPFFTTKPTGKGTGLGLAMAYGFMKQSGGGIHVDTAPDEGSTFHLRFPLSRQPGDRPRQAPAEEPRDTLATILVVDDEEAVRAVTGRVLERAGFHVRAAVDVASATELLEEGLPFDLLLTDLVLPDGLGSEVAERARSAAPGMPILVMSGFAEGSDDASARLPEGTGYVEKPFTRDQILDAVRSALARRRG